MAYHYESAVPWGRSFAEYREMFALSDSDLARRILGCADGPASFNAEMARRGRFTVSCDPLYKFSANQIRNRIRETYENVIGQTRSNQDLFVWTKIPSVEELGRMRLAAMEDFLADYDHGKREGRYVIGELPDLPFRADSFDLAVCSHYLFLYSPILSVEFHTQAVSAMCRSAREVRIFPLLTYDGTISPYVEPTLSTFTGNGMKASIVEVGYEFQRGGNQMMRIRRLSS
jgi:hypothetical protein